MRILVNRNGTQLGPYSEDELRAALQAGTVSATDLAWAEGTPSWVPVSSLLSGAPAGAPPELHPAAPQYAFPQAGAETSGLATASLVLGILSYICLGPFVSIPAIVCGHIARSKIAKSNGRLKGAGLALGGLITGYVNLLLLPVMIAVMMPAIMQGMQKGQEVVSLNNATQIVQGCTAYAGAHNGKYPDTLQQLVPDYLPNASALQSGTGQGFDYFLAGQPEPTDNRAVVAGQWKNRQGQCAVGRVSGTQMEKFDPAQPAGP